jgi:hypothetical protein
MKLCTTRPGAGVLLLLGLVAVLTASQMALAPVPAAAQGPTLSVTPTVLVGNGPWTVNVAGSRYLVPPHAPGTSVFGGVYLQFGWVRPTGGWGPSYRNANNTDGQFGVTYHYPGEQGDGATRDDGTGTAKFIAFTPGGIDATATDIHMDPAGNWSTTLNIAAAIYTWIDPATGSPQTVDCRRVTCGVYTIGAHGKASRTNEQFVPLTFAAASNPGAAPPPTAAPRPPSGGISQTPIVPGGAPVAGGGGTSGAPSRSAGPSQPTGGRNPQPGAASVPVVEAPTSTDAVPTTEEVSSTTTPDSAAVADTTTSTARQPSGSSAREQATATIPINDDGGSGYLLAVGFVAGLGALGAAAVVLARRRRLRT